MSLKASATRVLSMPFARVDVFPVFSERFTLPTYDDDTHGLRTEPATPCLSPTASILMDSVPRFAPALCPERGRFQAVRPLHPHQNRVITPREAARLQGFPDWFQFPSTKWHSFRCIGSSVSPILAERLFSIIAAAFDQADALSTGTQQDEPAL